MITKPFAIEALATRIRDMIQEAEPASLSSTHSAAFISIQSVRLRVVIVGSKAVPEQTIGLLRPILLRSRRLSSADTRHSSTGCQGAFDASERHIEIRPDSFQRCDDND